MQTRITELYLFDAVSNGDIEKVRMLKSAFPDLNMNARTDLTHRTALHIAANSNNEALLTLLLSIGCDTTLRDYADFTAFELRLSPSDYHESFSALSLTRLAQYYQYILECKNKLLPNEVALFYVHYIEDINTIIDKHPHLPKMGFIIKKPNCIRRMYFTETHVIRDNHVSPIYFERVNTQLEVAVHLDSIMGQVYFLPRPSNSQINRVSYYSPFTRQASGGGCFEDAVAVLTKLLTGKINFVEFCKSHSQPDTGVTKVLSKKELLDINGWYDRLGQGQRAQTVESVFPDLRRRYDRERLLLFYRQHNLTITKSLNRLTSLPPILYPYISFYSTMRVFRVMHTNEFLKKINPSTKHRSISLLDSILNQGTLRTPHLVSKEDIRNNIANAIELYDFKGMDFTKRMVVFKNFYHTQGIMLYTLFSKVPALKKMSGQADPAGIITEFITGYDRNFMPS